VLDSEHDAGASKVCGIAPKPEAGRWGRRASGSVSGYPLGHASCSLLVLPRVGQDENAASRG
jgi:hypothetical protein